MQALIHPLTELADYEEIEKKKQKEPGTIRILGCVNSQKKHINGHNIQSLYLSGGSCALPGVRDLFQHEFPNHLVVLPDNPIFLTPLAIAAYQPQQEK